MVRATQEFQRMIRETKNWDRFLWLLANVGGLYGWFANREQLPVGWIQWAAAAGCLLVVNLMVWVGFRLRRARGRLRSAPTPR